MHNLGRTYLFTDTEFEDDPEAILGIDDDDDDDADDEADVLGPAFASALVDDDDDEQEADDSLERPFSEDEELELAAELMEIQTDDELEGFLGEVMSRVERRRRRKKRRATALKKVGRGLKRVGAFFKKVLPMAGTAIGSVFGVPGAGNAIRGVMGRELEGLDPDEQELEVARRYVRLSGAAAKAALEAPSNLDDTQAARMALETAARLHVPGLLRRPGKPTRGRFELHGDVPGQRVLVIRGI